MEPIRVLFLADSHLGLDLPLAPRVERRRRGHDFLANHAAALAPALAGEADLVVHGGDVFHRPGIAPGLARLAYEPLLQAADRGVPVFIVPGNHERARLPHARFLAHPRVHVFDVARTYALEVRGVRIALSGFPYERRDVRTGFAALLERTRWRDHAAELRLLCIHHCVEGATVGPGNFTFTTARDVIRGRDLPPEFAAVLSGHIHRHQVLERQLCGRALPTPVLYPGSVERTSTAEIGEEKGYLRLELWPGRALAWEFVPLPARPMLAHTLPAGDSAGRELDAALRALVSAAPADAVLNVRVAGALTPEQLRVLSSVRLRAFVPRTMNVEIRAGDVIARTARADRRRRAPGAPVLEENLSLEL